MLDADAPFDGLTDWLASDDTGASAKSIVAHLTDRGDQKGDYPIDSADFGRCERLLDKVPSLRPELHRMAEVNAYWAALVPRWDEIAAADDKTYLIKKIVAPIQKADPGHIQVTENASMRTGPITFKGDGEDALYDQAVAIVIQDRKCSTSYIQRKLALGYNKAARLVEQMEDEGVVSAANRVGKREVLVTVEKAGTPAPAPAKNDKPRMKETAEDRAVSDRLHNSTGAELRQFIERVERLEEEKKEVADQIKEVFAEVKGRGFDVKAIRQIVRERKQDPNDLAEQASIVDMYRAVLGM